VLGLELIAGTVPGELPVVEDVETVPVGRLRAEDVVSVGRVRVWGEDREDHGEAGDDEHTEDDPEHGERARVDVDRKRGDIPRRATGRHHVGVGRAARSTAGQVSVARKSIRLVTIPK